MLPAFPHVFVHFLYSQAWQLNRVAEYSDPTDLMHHLCFLSMIDAKFTDEFGNTARSEYAKAWDALERFASQTPADDARQQLQQCIHNLRTAYEHLETGDSAAASKLVMETEQRFKECHMHIVHGDE